MIRTSSQYLGALNDGRCVYYKGSKIRDITKDNRLQVPVNHAAKLYEARIKLKDILTYKDAELGDTSIFFKIPRSSEDLLLRSKAVQAITHFSNGVFNITQAIGTDALFALMIATAGVDSQLSHNVRNYHQNVLNYHKLVAKNDLALATAQTDVKGDRSKRPFEQSDPDLYVRVVEETSEGIIVNGAKAHTTQSLAADQIIFIPCRAMTESDGDYAVSFAVPTNTKNLKLIVRPLLEVESLSAEGDAPLSSNDVEAETLTVLDHVLVPWENIFMYKDWKRAGEVANLFALFHRFTAVSYRAVTTNLFLGAARLAARFNGIENAQHVREDTLDIVLYKEIMGMASKLAAYESSIESNTRIAVPSSLYTNIGKLYSNANFANIVKAVVDVAGGWISTLPSTRDLENEETREYIQKYMKGDSRFTGEERFKLLRFVRELVGGPLAGYMLGLMIHAEGSVAASKIALYREYNFKPAEEQVEKIVRENENATPQAS